VRQQARLTRRTTLVRTRQSLRFIGLGSRQPRASFARMPWSCPALALLLGGPGIGLDGDLRRWGGGAKETLLEVPFLAVELLSQALIFRTQAINLPLLLQTPCAQVHPVVPIFLQLILHSRERTALRCFLALFNISLRHYRLIGVLALELDVARQRAVLIPAAMKQLNEAHAAFG
jgi:hypothetical protein